MELRKDSSHELPSPHIQIQPTLEDVLMVQEIVSQDDLSFEKIAKAMESRVMIAAAIIRTANSASAGSSQHARSLKHALALLGLHRVRSMLADMKLEVLGDSHRNGMHASA